MNDYLHEGIDLENTTKVWECDTCGKYFEDDESYQSDICPYCGSGYTTHEHMDKTEWKQLKQGLKYAVHPDETKTFTVGIIMPEFCDQRYLRDRDKDFEAKNEEQAIAKYREYAFKHYLNEDEKLAVMRGKIKIGIVE